MFLLAPRPIDGIDLSVQLAPAHHQTGRMRSGSRSRLGNRTRARHLDFALLLRHMRLRKQKKKKEIVLRFLLSRGENSVRAPSSDGIVSSFANMPS